MKLPTFVVIGAMKSGTTSLYHYLRAHPDVFMATPKELHFFSRHWSRGVAWYSGHFVDAQESIRGEVSSTYTRHPLYPGVADRLAEILPNARLVYLVRDPFARAVSNYKHGLLAGTHRQTFPDLVRPGSPYVDSSRYAYQLQQFLQRFSVEDILVVASEVLRDDRDRALDRVLRFVDADPSRLNTAVLRQEYHRTVEREQRPHWNERLWSIRRAPVLRRWFRRAPSWLRRKLIQIGTRPATAATPFLKTIPEAIPEQLLDIFRRDALELQDMIDTSEIPWISDYC